MNILESIVYGLISGLSEFLPISSFGHQKLLDIFFGSGSPEPLRDMFIHIAFLAAVFIGCGTYIEKIHRQLRQNTKPTRRQGQRRDRRAFYDASLLKGASFTMVLAMVILRFCFKSPDSLGIIAFLYLLNGIVLFLPEYIPHGNKDAMKMSAFDSFLLGLGSALSVLPGFSRVGCGLSCAVSRGADKAKAYNWVLVMTIPAALVFLVFDIIVVFQTGVGAITFLGLLGYILSGVFAFVSSLLGIYLMRLMLVRSNMTVFAFYCWGAALLSFLLNLSA